MTGGLRHAAALSLTVACLALPGSAQSEDLSRYIRDLTLTVRDMDSAARGTADNVRDMVADSGGDITMRETDDSIVLSVTSDVLFDFDSAALTPAAQDTLSRIAGVIAGMAGDAVQVVGHTDAKGPDAYNQRLSEQRANAVLSFLTQNDVPADRLAASGRGEAEPVAPNEINGADNPEGRAQNRRVEFVLPK